MKKVLLLCGILLTTLLFAWCKKGTSPEEKTNGSSTTGAEIDIAVLASGLSHIWEIVWGNDNQLWITQRSGKISRIDPLTGVVNDVIDIDDVEPRGEGGLLGMVLHPDFATNPQVFVVYNFLSGSVYQEKVVKYTYNGTALINPQILLSDIAASNIHNGSRLLISPDKKLFITTGDASDQPAAQNLSSVNGKILRINLDGTIPADNPDPQSPVWSSGHRNPQGLTFGNGKLYSSEHGPNNDDEINIIEKGRNYGWPNVQGQCNTPTESSFCLANNIAEPVYAWTPTLAVCGMQYYNHALLPQFKNSLLLCTLKQGTLYQLKLNNEGNAVEKVSEIISGTYGRLRAVCAAPDGKLYIGTSNGNNDKIIVIKKK